MSRRRILAPREKPLFSRRWNLIRSPSEARNTLANCKLNARIARAVCADHERKAPHDPGRNSWNGEPIERPLASGACVESGRHLIELTPFGRLHILPFRGCMLNF